MAIAQKEKKNYARLLYVEQGMTQKDVAAKVGVAHNTVNRWVQEERWHELKASFTITKLEQLKRLYAQVNELNTHILSREEGKRFANNKDADALIKLTASIKNLETDTSIADTINVVTRLVSHVRTTNLVLAQQIAEASDGFIRLLLQ